MAKTKVQAKEWTLAMFKESAAGHTSVKDWKKADPSAVNALNKRYRHWADEVKAHMTKYRQRWTDEMILEDAGKYFSLSMWTAMSPRAREAAYNRGKEFLAKCKAHMEPNPLPLGESFIMEFLLSHDIPHVHQYWLSEKPVDRMPYDFYIPGLDLFIEYQGRQHRLGWRGCKKSKKTISKIDRTKRDHIDRRGSHYLAIEAHKRDDVLFELIAKLNFLGWQKTPERVLTADEMRKVQCRIKWSKEAALKEAKKYSSRNEFQLGSPGAHGACKRNGWYEEACAHMDEIRHYWTNEEILKEGAKYKTNRELREKNYACYSVALNRGLIAQLNQLYTPLQVPKGTYTPEYIFETTKPFTYLKDWRKAHPSEDSAATKLGIYKEVTRNLLRVKPPNGTWTKEKCQEIALKCKSRREFYKKYGAAASACYTNGWTEEVLAHLPYQSRRPWTRKEVLEEAGKYEYWTQFHRGSPGAYDAAMYRLNMKDELDTILKRKQKPNNYWTPDRIIARAREFATRSEWANKCGTSYNKALQLGIMDECTAHMPTEFEARSAAQRIWTEEKIKEVAQKCPRKVDLKDNYGSAYAAALKLGIMDELYPPLLQDRKPIGHWHDPKNIWATVPGYNKICVWRDDYPAAYVMARKLGIYRQVSKAILG